MREVKSQINSSKTFKEIFYIAQQFTTTPNSFNPYSTHTLNNMDLVKMMTNKWKDWMKKYYKIIQGIEYMVKVQL